MKWDGDRAVRRVFAISVFTLAVTGLSVGLTACQTSVKSDNPSPKVLTTFTVLADMAQNVAGEGLVVESIPKPGTEIHSYEPTPSDLVRGQKAAVILENGFNLESWATRFYNSLPKVDRVTLTAGITPIKIAEDRYAGKPNPHAWMSPKNALIYVNNIEQALSKLHPDQAERFKSNAQQYRQKIQDLDTKLKQAIAQIPPDKRYIVTCEGAFSYLARDYGLKEAYLWAVNSERQATPQQIDRVINLVKAKQIPAIFCESTVSGEAQKQVAKATGAKFGGNFYVDSLSPPEGEAPTYLKLLEYNVNLLIQGLTSQAKSSS